MKKILYPNKHSKAIKILKGAGGSAFVTGGVIAMSGGIMGIPIAFSGAVTYLAGVYAERKYETKLKEYKDYMNSLDRYM